jgi:hypothetical protein
MMMNKFRSLKWTLSLAVAIAAGTAGLGSVARADDTTAARATEVKLASATTPARHSDIADAARSERAETAKCEPISRLGGKVRIARRGPHCQ